MNNHAPAISDMGEPAVNAPEVKTVGPIIIARHGRPSLDRTQGPRLSWMDYVDWWARYEQAGLAEGQEAPQALKDIVQDADVFLSSIRPRAIETGAKAAPDVSFEHHEIFREAPLPPPRLSGVRYLPKTWNVLARTAWLAGHALDGESVSEARVRAREAASMLHERAEEGKVFLAAHGWFNRMLRPELKRLGWRCRYDGGDRYWSFRVYEWR